MTKDAALKLALDWLEEGNFVYPTSLRTAIKEALAQPEPLEGLKLIHKADIDLAKKRALEAMQAQPEQKPVGRFAKFSDGLWRQVTEYSDGVMLYTTPPRRTAAEGEDTRRAWVGLTDEEAKKTFEKKNCTVSADLAGILARAITAKLKEKNT